jgi:DNA recombination protein RmuC
MMQGMIVPAVAAALCLGVGALICWVIMRSGISAAVAAAETQGTHALELARMEIASLREQSNRIPGLENSLAEVSGRLNESNEKKAALEAEGRRIPELNARITALDQSAQDTQTQVANLMKQNGEVSALLRSEQEISAQLRTDMETEKRARSVATNQLGERTTELAESRTRLENETRTGAEKLALLTEAKKALSDQFETLASGILEDKSKRFTEQNLTNLTALLVPLRERIAEFQTKVEDVYVKEGKDRSALAEQVRQLMELNQNLSEDAKNLTLALRGSSKTQGSWGELVLERVLEASGLRKGEEYTVQGSITREDGTRALPDVVIHLPAERNLVVDAKVSLLAYEEFMQAEEEPARINARKRHLDSVRTHIRGLSERNYQTLYGLKSLDFVLLFVPIEPAFMLAITGDRELFMDAWKRNVLLVSPSTLLFVVRTVAHLWRQEAQTRNAQEIAKCGGDLYDKFVGFVEDMSGLGTRLTQAQREYDQAYGKLVGGRGNLVGQAEKLKELGVRPTKSHQASLLDASTEETQVAVRLPQLPAQADCQPVSVASHDAASRSGM